MIYKLRNYKAIVCNTLYNMFANMPWFSLIYDNFVIRLFVVFNRLLKKHTKKTRVTCPEYTVIMSQWEALEAHALVNG